MSIDLIAKIYFAMALAFMVVTTIKLYRHKNGESGWQKLKRSAEKEVGIGEGVLAFATISMVLMMGAIWPLVLMDMLARKKNPS